MPPTRDSAEGPRYEARSIYGTHRLYRGKDELASFYKPEDCRSICEKLNLFDEMAVALTWLHERMLENARRLERRCYCDELDDLERGPCDYCLDSQAMHDACEVLSKLPKEKADG